MDRAVAVVAALAIGASAQTCPLADEFGYAFPNGVEDTDHLGGLVVRGFDAANAQACESCSVTTRSEAPGLPSDGVAPGTYYGYDYGWNAASGGRDFWQDSGKGWKQSVSWYSSCGHGYVSDRKWYQWSGKCQIPDSHKFLGEACSRKSQCANGFTNPYVDLTCAPTSQSESAPDLKCVFDEDANWLDGESLESTCDCFGLLYCHSDDCNGNMCVLSTFDMQKHCKYGDDDGFADVIFGTTQCTNCRASENPCGAYGGGDAYGRRRLVAALSHAHARVILAIAVLLVVVAIAISSYVAARICRGDAAPEPKPVVVEFEPAVADV